MNELDLVALKLCGFGGPERTCWVISLDKHTVRKSLWEPGTNNATYYLSCSFPVLGNPFRNSESSFELIHLAYQATIPGFSLCFDMTAQLSRSACSVIHGLPSQCAWKCRTVLMQEEILQFLGARSQSGACQINCTLNKKPFHSFPVGTLYSHSFQSVSWKPLWSPWPMSCMSWPWAWVTCVRPVVAENFSRE